MGDDRDDSADSRLEAGGFGFVPVDQPGRPRAIHDLFDRRFGRAPSLDLVQRRALGSHRGGVLTWLAATLGVTPRDEALYRTALTHPSHGADNYQRLEFLGDRVLGLIIAEWLQRAVPA